MSPRTVEAAAPAKINLALHVTGRRPDGYHELDSLVVFGDICDTVRVSEAATASFTVSGAFSVEVPQNEDNLVVKALELAGAPPCAVELVKRLPAASGIGGGSSDAAAALRAVAMLTGIKLPRPDALTRLGADLPVCLAARPARMRGIGDTLDPLPRLPAFHLVLVNPGTAVATADVFRGLGEPENPPLPADLPDWPDATAFARWLDLQRNDLECAARGLEPGIGAVLSSLAATSGCLITRMSGSGATCFGLYASRPEADAATADLRTKHRNWWISATTPLSNSPPVSFVAA